MKSQTTGHRFLFLDALRGLGALIVMLYHFTEFLGIPLVPVGFAFVDFFFVLSGFVIAHAYSTRIADGLSASGFMVQRIARLYPLYFLGLALGGVILLLRSAFGMTQLGLWEALGSIALNLFYLPWFNTAVSSVFGMEFRGELYPANSPAWSLFFELAINLLFFYMIRVRSLLLAASVAAAYLIFVFRVYAGFGVGGWGAENFFSGFPRVYYGFFAGYLLHEVFALDRMRDFRRFLAGHSLAVMGLILTTCCCIAGLALDDLRISFLIAITAFPALVLAGAMVAVSKRLVGICTWAGALSYPIYCLHYPIALGFEFLISAGLIRPPVAILLGMEIAVTLLISVLAIRFYERPCRALISAMILRSQVGLRGRKPQ